jgi:hypothetical protein
VKPTFPDSGHDGISLISRANVLADGSDRSNTFTVSVKEGVKIPAKIEALAG